MITKMVIIAIGFIAGVSADRLGRPRLGGVWAPGWTKWIIGYVHYVTMYFIALFLSMFLHT